MTVDWEDYRPDWPPFEGSLRLLARREARISYEHFLGERSNRIDQLKGLLTRNGLYLPTDEASLQVANEWFDANVERSEKNPEQLENLWYSLVHDFSVLIGEIIITRHPGLHWELFLWGKRDLSFQSPVIMGFKNLANPRVNVNLTAALVTHAHRVAHGLPEDPNYFVALVRGAGDLLAIGRK